MDFLADVAGWLTTAENWTKHGGMLDQLVEHVRLSIIATLLAGAIALPIGIGFGHLRRGGTVAVAIANLWRALPSYALLILSYKVFGLGDTPIYVTLVALAAPPMLVNAYVGMSEVDLAVREAARGMGMTGWQSLRRVELPLALPLVMAGVRTAAVQVVATATLAAFIAGGGLGRIIVDGRAVNDNVRVFAGALAVATLSVVTELVLAGLQRRATPRGRRPLIDPNLSLTKGTTA